jgi:hypothetical protein
VPIQTGVGIVRFDQHSSPGERRRVHVNTHSNSGYGLSSASRPAAGLAFGMLFFVGGIALPYGLAMLGIFYMLFRAVVLREWP